MRGLTGKRVRITEAPPASVPLLRARVPREGSAVGVLDARFQCPRADSTSVSGFWRLPLDADVSNLNEVRRHSNDAIRIMGGVMCLINNAGSTSPQLSRHHARRMDKVICRESNRRVLHGSDSGASQ